MTDGAREWAKRLGTVGVWTHDVERMPVGGARDYVHAIESLGFAALWIPESLGSKEAFEQMNRAIDTSLPSGDDFAEPGQEIRLDPSDHYIANPRSTVVLLAR